VKFKILFRILRLSVQIMLFIIIGLFILGCATLGPEPSNPEVFFYVTVSSIPTGASVYELANDGSLGRFIGMTPYNIEVGLATRRYSNGQRSFGHTFFWANGIKWGKYKNEEKYFRGYWELLLQIAVVKEGYYTSKVTDKVVGLIGKLRSYPPQSTTVTIQLRPITEIHSPTTEQKTQQQQQQQQTVVLPDTSSKEQNNSGSVMLTSIPEDADVYVDGIFVSNSPANLKLKDGIHIIEVRKKGYKTDRKEIRVLSGSEVTLRITLDTD